MLFSLVGKTQPDEIYNLGAMSHVGVSFQSPEATADVDALGPLKLLEAIRSHKLEKKTKFYQASTSELYGKAQAVPQSESTPFHPRSPYAVAKLYGYWITVNYREAYDMYACNGILFNHESPLRGLDFVTRKITHSLAAIKNGNLDCLKLGNLSSKRDWGYAKEYVEGMWLMLQQSLADDFVLATGETHTVREFVDLALKVAGFKYEWHGDAGSSNEKVVDTKTGKTIVGINENFYRPAEVDLLIGNASKAEKILGWKPKTSFHGLVELMMKYDLENYEKSHHHWC
jgi:GDPmannose 4,6-dehydratase